jgi:molecular chaperone DnaK
VTFEIDADGIVRVSAKDVGTHREHTIEVKPSSGLTGQQIDKIIKRKQTEESPT